MPVSPISPQTLAFSLSLLLALLAAPCLQAIEVTTTADENGDNPAACALREAVTAINDGASFGGCVFSEGDALVELGAGTYQLSLDLGLELGLGSDRLRIAVPMTILGEGPGVTTVERAGAFDDDVIGIVHGAGTVTLEGFTVRGATGDSHSAISSLAISGSGLVLRDMVLRENSGEDAPPLDIDGSGDGTVELERVVFEDNMNVGGSGGGIKCNTNNPPATPSVQLVHVLFRNNVAGASGGGIFSRGCNLDLSHVTFDGNSTEPSQGAGGGLALLDYTSTATDVTFTNVTFFGNSAAGGGGLFQFGGGGGAAFVTTFTNVTFAENTAAVAGDHIFQNSATARLRNVLFGPTPGADCDGFLVHSFTLLGGNVDSDGTCGVERTEADPGLADALAHHGGATPTLALAPRAAAIDAGTNSDCPATDQRGAPRPFDGDSDDVALCDAGAYEVSDIDVFSDGFEAGDASAWSDEVP